MRRLPFKEWYGLHSAEFEAEAKSLGEEECDDCGGVGAHHCDCSRCLDSGAPCNICGGSGLAKVSAEQLGLEEYKRQCAKEDGLLQMQVNA
jgi:hypothetical protein